MDFSSKRVDFVKKQVNPSIIKNPRKFLTHRDLRRVPGRTRTVDIQNHNLTL